MIDRIRAAMDISSVFALIRILKDYKQVLSYLQMEAWLGISLVGYSGLPLLLWFARGLKILPIHIG